MGLSSPRTTSAHKSTIRIGALAPLTRPGWVEAGRHLVAGIELAVRAVNDSGGIRGCPLEFIVRDTAADPDRAAAAVDELASLGVTALAGEYHSIAACAIASRAHTLRLPFLCSSAVMNALTEQPSDWVARLAPAQSEGWRTYADYLLISGHKRVAVAAQSSAYWTQGVRILRDYLSSRSAVLTELEVGDIVSMYNQLESSNATAILLLVGYPAPILQMVRAVRNDRRLDRILIGAPAGQPEFSGWEASLGDQGAAVPFLRYTPEHLSELGEHVETALRAKLGRAPSFVALEGYDTILVLSEALRAGADRASLGKYWPHVSVKGTRGKIELSQVQETGVWQWAQAPIQVVERDLAAPGSIRLLHAK